MMSTSSFITQEYFDELCVENYEVFEMSNKKEAVLETLAQLQQSSNSGGNNSTKHLTLTYPDEFGDDIRTNIRDFQEALRTLQSMLGSERQTIHPPTLFDTVYECLHSPHNDAQNDDGIALFANLFLIQGGFRIYFSVLHQQIVDNHHSWDQSIERILLTMKEMVSRSANDTTGSTLSQFQASAKISIVSLTKLFEREVDGIEFQKSRIVIILSIIYSSITHCEANKKLWIACQTENSNFAKILMKTLQHTATTITGTNHNESLSETRDISQERSIQCWICRIVTTLCTFDDFQVNQEDKTSDSVPVVQSGHTAVQALYQVGAVTTMHQLLLIQQCQKNDREKLDKNVMDEESIPVVFTFSALRAMAIQDDVVQCIEKIGVIDIAKQVLSDTLMAESSTRDGTNNSCQLVTAVIGLFRNVCANDDIKTLLCTGKYKDVVSGTILAMEMYHDIALLQEHGCGLFAAMALRKPKNATTLVASGVHNCIVNISMRQHPTSVTVQRQGALAIRNIVSRSPELRPMLLNDCDTEATLRTIAGQHLQCQDEVYAALRDLGLDTRSVHVHHADDGTITIQEGRLAFGVRNPNFRPDFTTSDATENRK